MSERRRPRGYKIAERLAEHKRHMDRLMAGGMGREDASRKAYQIVTGITFKGRA